MDDVLAKAIDVLDQVDQIGHDAGVRAYSIYQAKARLSEIVRSVKRSRSVTITERGRPVALVVPFEPPRTLVAHIEALEASGQVLPATGRWPETFKPMVRKGALRRFLAERSRS